MAGKGSADGCCASCAKWCLIIFNVLFCLIGVGLIAAGAYVYIELSDYLQLFSNEMLNAPAIVLIVFGCITFIIAALGCIGACKESACLLFTFAVIVGILLVAEIAAGAAAFVYSDELEAWFDEAAPSLMRDYSEGSSGESGLVDAWDAVQEGLECCGINGPADWYNQTTSPNQDEPPTSCGKPAYTQGCKDALIAFVVENIYIIGGVGIAFGLIELFGIVFACCVGCNIRKGTNV